ncbi:MAG: exosortase/archaeosortase family protein [Acidobacteriia bacterium]|nr:exosortase/archaeosortase family protein [Terriglobia bacterium]
MRTLGSAMLSVSNPSLLKTRALVYAQGVILFLLAAWLYAPFALGLASQWWHDPNYTHGFFVPVFSLFLLWERRAKLAALRRQPAWSGLVILLLALLALVLSTIDSGFFLYRISCLLFITGLVVFMAGWKHLATISFPLAFLILMIPSSTLLGQITLPLQIVASKTASFLLMLVGIPAVREGNIILLPTAQLEVAEACSGIRSLFSLITLTVIYGYLAEAKISVRVLLVLIAVPISVLANALRIAITGVVVESWGIEGVQGTLHLLSGWLIFAGSLALVFLLHRLSHALFLSKHKAGVREEYA